MHHAGAIDGQPKKVAATLKDGSVWKTVIGDISYDAKGDLVKPGFVMYTVKKTADGKLEFAQN